MSGVIFVLDGDGLLLFFDLYDAAIGDGDTENVSSEVINDALGIVQGGHNFNDPVLFKGNLIIKLLELLRIIEVEKFFG